MSIIASPTLSADVRHKSTGLLKQLYEAYSNDKTGKKEPNTDGAAGETKKSGAKSGGGLAATVAARAATDPNAPQPLAEDGAPAFSTPDPRLVAPGTQTEAQILEHEIESNHLEDRVEDTPVSTDETLRVHGIYMSKRRHFEVRVDPTGRLILWDSDEGKIWGT